MTVSAFGVDHGYEDIEKIGLGGVVSTVGRRLGMGVSQAGRGVQRMGQQNAARTGSLRPKMGGMANRAGLGIRRAGAAMGRNPGVTGGVAAGGAAAGAGGIGASMFNRKR